MEKWEIIKEYENYSISTYGRVKNNKTNHILTPHKRRGYLKVGFYIGKYKSKRFFVHRLVAMTFIPNPECKPTVNHKDRNPSNNYVENLEWATSKEQTAHLLSSQIKTGFSLRSARGVWRINKSNNEKLEYYKSIKLAAVWVANNTETISNISNIKSKICGVARNREEYQSGNRYFMKGSKAGQQYIVQRKVAYGFNWEYETYTSLENEIWKDLKCINNAIGYKISNLGRIVNRTGRLAKAMYKMNSENDLEYPEIIVMGKNYRIHILVAKEFIENPQNHPIVNHIDGNKLNYNAINLEWVTYKENANHAIRLGLKTKLKFG